MNVFLQTIILLALVGFCPVIRAETVDKILAKVGVEVITRSDFDQALQAKKLTLAQAFGEKEGAVLFAKFKANALEEMVMQKILESEIRREKIAVSSREVDGEYQNRLRASRLQESDFILELAKFGVSFAVYKDSLKKELEQQQFVQKKIMPNLSVSDYDVQKEYDRNRGKYTTFSKYRFTEAFLTPDKFATPDDLVKMAEQIYASLKAGRSAAPLITAHSSGAFKDKGGDSGLVEAASLRPEIKQALASLKPGETARPFPLGPGLYICKLVAASEPVQRPLSEVSNAIRNRLGEREIQASLREYLLAVKDQTFVQILK